MGMPVHAPLLVVAVLDGCGESPQPAPTATGKQAPASRPASSAVAPDARESAGEQPAPGTYSEQDFATFVSFRERACVCADAPCADAVWH